MSPAMFRPMCSLQGNSPRLPAMATHRHLPPHVGLQRMSGGDPVAQPRIKGASLYRLPIIRDLRGALSFGEIERPLPFLPKRYFVIFDVPSTDVRGQHAHRTLHQFLVCLHGSCEVVLDDGATREEVLLSTPTLGLHIPPMVWSTQHKYSSDAILLVLASDVYDASDYIREYGVYLAALTATSRLDSMDHGADDRTRT